MGEEGDWFVLLGDRMFFYRGLFCWFSRRNRSPIRLAARWFIRSVQICSGMKLQRNFKCVMFMLRHRRPFGGLSADAVEEEADGSFAFDLGN